MPAPSTPRDVVAGRHRHADRSGRHRRVEGVGRHRATGPVTVPGRGAAVAVSALTGVAVVAAAVAAETAAGSESSPASPAARLAPQAVRVAPVVSDAGVDAPVRAGTPMALPVLRLPSLRATPLWVDPMPAGAVTSCFGPRWGRQHAGVDLAAAAGTTVVAAGAGRVVSAGADYGGYGISVLIEHAGGFSTHYAHLSAVEVKPGDTVAAGQPIGAEGSTGNSTGPHLHFEVRDGGWDNTVEPAAWMRERGVELGCAS